MTPGLPWKRWTQAALADIPASRDFFPYLCPLCLRSYTPSSISDQPLPGAWGRLSQGAWQWHGLCASLHRVDIEQHEGKNENGLAFWVVLNNAVVFW